MTTRREELNNLMNEMRGDETAAMKEAATLFASPDMQTFVDTLASLRDRTVPGSHYDQIFTNTLSVLNSTKTMLDQTFPVDKPETSSETAPQPLAAPTDQPGETAA